MASAVYDPEPEKTVTSDGSHDKVDLSDDELAKLDEIEKNYDADAPAGDDKASLSPDEIKTAEKAGDSSVSESGSSSWDYNPTDNRSRFAKVKSVVIGSGKKRGLFIGGGLGAAIVAILIAGFLTLLPLKILNMVENLQSRFFATSESAMQRQTELMLSGYIKKYVAPSLTKCSGRTIDRHCNALIGTGTNPVLTLYRGWSNARIENRLAEKYGIEIVLNKPSGRYFLRTPGFGDVNGQDITPFLNRSNPDTFGEDLFDQLEPNSRHEVRLKVRAAVANETKWKQAMYRFKVGRLLERKYGIKRCIFFCKTRDNVNDWKVAQTGKLKTNAAKAIFSQRVLGPRAEIYGIVVECIVSGEDCVKIREGKGEGVNGEKYNKFQRELQNKLDALAQKYGTEAVEEIVKSAEALSEKGFTRYAVEKVVNTVFNKFASTEASETAANAAGDVVPVIGAINLAANTITTIKNGTKTIKYMSYAASAASAIGVYSTYRTLADETKSGHADSALLGSFTDSLSPGQHRNDDGSYGGAGMEGAPLYGALYGTKDNQTVFNLMPSASAAEVDTTHKCDDGKNVPVGKLICPEESFKHKSFADSIDKALKQPPLSIAVSVADAIHNTAGKVISFVGNSLSSIISKLPGVKQLGNAVGDIVSPLLEALVKVVIPSAASDNMSGARTWVLAAGGANAAGMDFAHHGLGGRVMSQAEVQPILAAREADEAAEFNNSSLFAKIFDKNSNRSLVTKVAMAMPSNLNNAISTGFANLLHNPFSAIMNSFGSVFGSKPAAAADNVDMCSEGGPFGVTCYGYSDSEIPKDPEAYWDQHCQTSKQTDAWNEAATKTINEDTAQLENKTTDPCLLIQATVGSDGALFTDEVLTPDDLAGGATSTAANPQPDDGGIGKAADGFVFPLRTTQTIIKTNKPAWCYTNQNNCHHDYNAADIFAPSGTPVLAAHSGTVIRIAYSSTHGHRITIKGDGAKPGDKQGFVYFYNHMAKDSPGLVNVGMNTHVEAGQQIGAVGNDTEAESTPHHLHFDMLPPSYNFRVSCEDSECAGIPFIKVQPILIEAFNNLPK